MDVGESRGPERGVPLDVPTGDVLRYGRAAADDEPPPIGARVMVAAAAAAAVA